MPPLRIRNSANINSQLGFNAIIDGFVEIPVFTHSDDNINDDVAYHGCENSVDSRNYYFGRPETYADIQQPYFDVLKQPMKIAFNLT
jgi:hypothetical protein